MTRSWTVLTLALACLAVVGCETEVRITWTNTTAQEREVELTAPGYGRGTVGVVAADGGKLAKTLKIDNDDLPATCAWQAGDQQGQFTITKETPGKLWIDVKPGGPGAPRDERTKVKDTRKVEVKDLPVERRTVVE